MNGSLQRLREGFNGGSSAFQGADVVAVVLIFLVLAVLLIGSVFVWLASRHLHALRAARQAQERASFAGGFPEQSPNHASLFESPTRWLAVRGGDPQSVQAALGLHNTAACSWEEGLAHARDQRLFISPAIGEWVLVVGSGLPDPSEDVDVCYRFLTALSRKLGHVQFFSANRIVAHHAWARLEAGRVCRAYAWAGHTVWNQGRLTLTEMDLNLECFGYGESGARVDFAHPDPAAVNTEKVASLAARWSVDPATIDERQLKAGHGIKGDLSARLF